MLGVAYKKDVDDMRESPSLEVMEILIAKGAEVHYSDPHVPRLPKMRSHNLHLDSVSLEADNIRQYDCVILTTAHTRFDYSLIAEHARLIIDTRAAFRAFKQENIVRA